MVRLALPEETSSYPLGSLDVVVASVVVFVGGRG